MELAKGNAISDIQCRRCKKVFGKKSSLVRHIKICPRQISNPRQKSCDGCSSAKTRCGLQRPSCSRCLARQISCKYRSPGAIRHESPNNTLHVSSYDEDYTALQLSTAPVENCASGPLPSDAPSIPAVNQSEFIATAFPASPPQCPPVKDFTFESLMNHFGDTCGDAGALLDMQALTPEAWNRTVVSNRKPLSAFETHCMTFSFRVLCTWPRMMVTNIQNPPIIHFTQLAKGCMAAPLAHCYTIAKMWDGQYDDSADLVCETVVREMTHLFHSYKNFDEAQLGATLQAMVIYMIILLFPVKEQLGISIVDMAILANLQRLINYVGGMGLVLHEETEHVRPKWEDWINIASRRRAVFALYLVHWTLSVHHGLPSFDCQDLKYMFAPAPRVLWQARNAKEWESHYNRWLVDWQQHEYLHGEVNQIRSSIFLDRRSEKWLEETDELGMLLMALGENPVMDQLT